MKTIYTLNDAREERMLMESRREHARAVKEARAKVAHWTKMAAKYNGEVQRETLARMQNNLAAVLDS